MVEGGSGGDGNMTQKEPTAADLAQAAIRRARAQNAEQESQSTPSNTQGVFLGYTPGRGHRFRTANGGEVVADLAGNTEPVLGQTYTLNRTSTGYVVPMPSRFAADPVGIMASEGLSVVYVAGDPNAALKWSAKTIAVDTTQGRTFISSPDGGIETSFPKWIPVAPATYSTDDSFSFVYEGDMLQSAGDDMFYRLNSSLTWQPQALCSTCEDEPPPPDDPDPWIVDGGEGAVDWCTSVGIPVGTQECHDALGAFKRAAPRKPRKY